MVSKITKETIDSLVENILLEVLRGFNLNKFKQLPDLATKTTYAKQILPLLGKGSSRIVFALSGDKVLKIARDQKGIAQNHAELELFTNPKTKPVIARIFDADSGYEWLISELVKPLDSSEEAWKEATGFDYKFFNLLIKDWEKAEEPPPEEYMKNLINSWQERLKRLYGKESEPIYKTTQARLKNYIRMSKSPLVMGSFNLLDQGLVSADLIHYNSEKPGDNVIGHYGKTLDGRLVLLDYGYTVDVWQKHYKQPEEEVQQQNPTSQSPSEDEEPFFVPTGQSLK